MKEFASTPTKERRSPTRRPLTGSLLPAGELSELADDAGVPLDRPVRKRMERRFHHDFSKVRIHPEGRAADGARARGALAYTLGSDIVFAPGRFQPRRPEGLQLLAHELAHVVQQSGGSGGSPPGQAHEQDAQAAELAVRDGARARVRARSRVGIAAQHHTQHRPPNTAALKTQLETRASDLLSHFNFEMNALQNNLGIVAKVIDTTTIPKADLGGWLTDRLISEGLEAIPFAPLAEALKVAHDVYTKYDVTDQAAKAAELRNEIMVFTATQSNDLLVDQHAFAVVHDLMIRAANSGDAAWMTAALKIAPDPRPLVKLLQEGVAYRIALDHAFLANFVSMRAVVYHPSPGEVLGTISRSAIRHRIQPEGPQYDVADLGPSGPGGQGAGGWLLRRWIAPSNPFMDHLLHNTDGGGGGYTYDTLYYWYLTEPKARHEVRIAGTQKRWYPQVELDWLFH